MSFTMVGRSLLLRAVFTPEAVTLPTEFEVALTRFVAPSNATAAQLVEPVGGGYVRQEYPVGLAAWAPTGFGSLYNTTKITFPQVSATWGLLAGWALVDPASGQCIDTGALKEPMATVVGMIPYVDPGALVLGIED
jgi:hypothetical protein